MNIRNLAIEPHQFHRGQPTKAKIRIVGKWLQSAGFTPGTRVEVQILATGLIQLRAQTLNVA